MVLALVLLGCTSPDDPVDSGGPPSVPAPAQVERSFTDVYPPADVLFVVDSSCSMYEEQTRLVADAPQVLPLLLDGGLDVHVGVTTMDLGGLGPASAGQLAAAGAERFVTPTTPSPADVFAQMASLGTSGDMEPQARATAYALIQLQPDITANVGFYRPEGTLAVVFVTDEDDASGPDPITHAEFLAWADQLKARPEDTVLHGIAPVPGSPCAGSGPGALQIQGYAVGTGGELVDACASSWTAGLTAMVERVLDSARVTLPEDPVGTPEVAFLVDAASGAVEFTLDPTVLTWDAPSRTVFFDRGVRPGPTDTVRVRYTPL